MNGAVRMVHWKGWRLALVEIVGSSAKVTFLGKRNRKTLPLASLSVKPVKPEVEAHFLAALEKEK